MFAFHIKYPHWKCAGCLNVFSKKTGFNFFFSGFKYWYLCHITMTSIWNHNGRYGVSNHQPYDCSLNRSFGCRSKETSKLRVTGLCAGNSPGPVNSPHKWPVTRKMFRIVFPIWSISQLLIPWCWQEPGHLIQQAWHWYNFPGYSGRVHAQLSFSYNCNQAFYP